MFSLRTTVFRRPEHHCRVWPWLRLRPSSQGIPASQVYPEHKAIVTCCRRHKKSKTKRSKWTAHLRQKFASRSRENPWQNTNLQADAKTKTAPSGKLMIHKRKKCLQHQRLLIIYRSHQVVIIVCLPQSLVTLLGDVRQEWGSTKILLHWKKSFLLCKTEMTLNSVLVFINFCLCCGKVQSRLVCLFKNPGLAHRALWEIYL